MIFTPKLNPPIDKHLPSLWFLFRGGDLLTQKNVAPNSIPLVIAPKQLGIPIQTSHYLGTLDNQHCFCAELSENQAIPSSYELLPLRESYPLLGEMLFSIAGRAFQIIQWDKNHQFCGRCGEPIGILKNERAKICMICQLTFYPRMSPCVLIAVTRGEEILFARSPYFRSGIFSLLAGFIEPGESAEETVVREVKEEVGLTVKNIRYIESQSWPFPDRLMLAFAAEYASGEIKIDPVEIEAAGWYTAERLPPLPDPITLSRRVIDCFLQKNPK
jgi:NAD+ diphosphatase